MDRKFWGLLFFGGIVAASSYAAVVDDSLKSFNTASNRLNALQLNVSIEDESNPISINKWAGNPAGILLDESRSRVTPIFEADKIKINPDIKTELYTYGTMGLWRNENSALQTTLAGLNYNSFSRGSRTNKLDEAFGDIILNQKFGPFLAALQGGWNSASTPNRIFKSKPFTYGGGLGLSLPHPTGTFDAGAFMKVDNSDSNTRGSDQTKLGLQAMLHTGASSVGLYYNRTSDKIHNSLSTSIREEKQISDDFKLRGFLTSAPSNISFGAEAGLLKTSDKSKNSSGITTSDSDDTTRSLTFGPSIKLSQRAVIGAEASFTTTEVDYKPGSSRDHTNTYRAGGELKLAEKILARISYGIQGYGWADTQTWGLGFGLHPSENMKMDLSYRYQLTSYDHFESQFIENIIGLDATFYFGKSFLK